MLVTAVWVAVVLGYEVVYNVIVTVSASMMQWGTVDVITAVRITEAISEKVDNNVNMAVPTSIVKWGRFSMSDKESTAIVLSNERLNKVQPSMLTGVV